jgi:outer membrane protein assembly factor BamE
MMRAHRVHARTMRFALIFAACTLVSACGLVYKIDVQQGNYVTQDLVAKLKPGMTKAEVKQLLGTPLLSDVFHANRWDYFFSNAKGGKPGGRTRLTIDFKDDKVVSFTGAGQPSLPPPVGPAVGQAAPPAGPAAK